MPRKAFVGPLRAAFYVQSGGNILRADAVGVTGCSRFGKGAFTVGVFDQRIALTMPIESGTAGVPIWRGVPGEGAQSLSSAYGEQPWFGDAFTSFTGTPTRAPIDTHSLVAMVAPRGLLIIDTRTSRTSARARRTWPRSGEPKSTRRSVLEPPSATTRTWLAARTAP